MSNWLLKTEPSEYAASDLAKSKVAVWDGVANALAQKHLKSFKKGDSVLIYHTGKEKQIVALAVCNKEAFLDPKDNTGKLVVVELKFERLLDTPLTLEAIKSDPAFEGWDLLRIGRLSVVPTSQAMYDRVIQLATSKKLSKAK
jgi:predicted RNA-binding protein with PUA-like domain